MTILGVEVGTISVMACPRMFLKSLFSRVVQVTFHCEEESTVLEVSEAQQKAMP